METIFLSKEIFDEYGPEFHRKLVEILGVKNITIIADPKIEFLTKIKNNKLDGITTASIYAVALQRGHIELAQSPINLKYFKHGEFAESFNKDTPDIIYLTRAQAERFYSQKKLVKTLGHPSSMSWREKRPKREKTVNFPFGYSLTSLDFLAPILRLLDENYNTPSDITDIEGKPLSSKEFFQWIWMNLGQLNANLAIVDGYYFFNVQSFQSCTHTRFSKEKHAKSINDTHLFLLLDALAFSDDSVVQNLQIIEWIDAGQNLDGQYKDIFALVKAYLTNLNAQFNVEVYGISKGDLKRAVSDFTNVGLGFVWGTGVSLHWHHSSQALLEPTTPKICLAGTPAGESISKDKNEINIALKNMKADYKLLYSPAEAEEKYPGWE